MKRRALAALLLACAAEAHAAPIPGLFNTGVDNSGTPIADGAVDPHYILFNSADPSYPGPNAIAAAPIAFGYWYSNNALSRWIAPNILEGYPTDSTPHPAGIYVYRLSFDLTGLLPATASINGLYGADNQVTVNLNGAPTGNASAAYNPLGGFTISSGFAQGVNNLDFYVDNWNVGGGPNPTGLRVEGLSGTATSSVGVGDETDVLELSSPSPNPSYAQAQFAFSLPRAGAARLCVCDLAGRVVRTLVNGEHAAGRFTGSWDGRMDSGGKAGAGVYFVLLESVDGRALKRLVRLP